MRQTLRQLPAFGVRLAVVHTGHAPLDLIHLIKRVCAEVEGGGTGPSAMGLCYLELNAVLGTGLGPTGPLPSTTRPRWRRPGSRHLSLTSWTPTGCPTIRRPRSSASMGRTRGSPLTRRAARRRSTAAATLLADRAAARAAWRAPRPVRGPADVRRALLAGAARRWRGRAGHARRCHRGGPAILITNPAPVSRYLSGLALQIDGRADRRGRDRRWSTRRRGRPAWRIRAAELGPERGFYVRRHADRRGPPAGSRSSRAARRRARPRRWPVSRDGLSTETVEFR